eukprot:7726238-Pyramimonas_sp.AAC.1
MMLSLSCRAHSCDIKARASRIQGGWFSRCGSRFSAAHIFVDMCKRLTDGGRVVFKISLSLERRA